jgi:hypothetical protein
MELPILARIAALVKRRTRANRRQARRFTPPQPSQCTVRGGDGQEPCQAAIHNLSPKGAGLVARREYAPGTVVHLLLVNAGHTFALAVELKIARCFRMASGDYFLGGPFTRTLRHDELAPFMI